MKLSSLSFDIATLSQAYREQALTAEQVVDEVLRRIGADVHKAWITVLERSAIMAYVEALADRDPASLPLWGLPFAIKDNIDLAGVLTTVACPAYAYTPAAHAFVVQRLIDAGAIPIGKTNLDQFATGLNGTRSPYGVCLNSFDPSRISGGSSSGSAVALALGQVSFSLGTDTAGSGRVPAAFNNLVGLKPSCGVLSTSGMVPACRSLDSLSIFALTAEDAECVFKVAQANDAQDVMARPLQPHGYDMSAAIQAGRAWRLGVPQAAQLVFTEAAYATAFAAAIDHARSLGAEIVPLDFAPFLETARQLYEGPFVAERYAAIRHFIDAQPQAVLPVTRSITLSGKNALAADLFEAQLQLRANKHRCDAVWHEVDAVMTPTTPGHPGIAAVLNEPLLRNSELGIYTNFMNLLDYAAVAVPFCFTPAGLPFGVTLFAPAHQDLPLLRLAAQWQHSLHGRAATLGATACPLPDPVLRAVITPTRDVPTGQVQVAVCGAHLQGQPLNHQLTARGARLVTRTLTAPVYRLYALAGGPPFRPGLIPVTEGGAAIEVEVWELPVREFGSLVAAIPPPLGIGSTLLANGKRVPGFICEAIGLEGAQDITHLGGWRAYLAMQSATVEN